MLRPAWRFCPGWERLSCMLTNQRTSTPKIFCTSQKKNFSQSQAARSLPTHSIYPIRRIGPLALIDSPAQFSKRLSQIPENPAAFIQELKKAPGDSHPVLLAVGCPPDIRRHREQLFHVSEDLEYTPEEWNIIWPWVKNLWRVGAMINYKDYLSCFSDCPLCKPPRPSKNPYAPPRRAFPRPDSNELCDMAIHIRFMYEKSSESKRVDRILVSRTKQSKSVEGHNHSLQDTDLFRRNYGVKWALEFLKARSYGPSVALRILQAKFNKNLERHYIDAGGEAITKHEKITAGSIKTKGVRIYPYLMNAELDEVRAALDQVHAALVGRILRTDKDIRSSGRQGNKKKTTNADT